MAPDRRDEAPPLSALIRAGESVKTVQVALGTPAVETLQIYVGLSPENQRARAAIDDLNLNKPAVGAVRDISRTD